ncbi:DegV family protein [Mycoplasma leonicaptivi]|uniref:DegV family protein n=1 Tax=Mycoplasma leonicaptivi TaxID=36742 RepID=UPI0004805ADC|nr:DegV family protein [Mycoplasma leonicaptivi]
MKKLGVIIDSFSCVSQEKTHELGFKFLPLQIEIDGQVFQDGIDNKDVILQKLKEANDYKTSSPKLSIINDVVDDLARSCDDVIFVGISSSLSGTAAHVRTKALEYNNVHIMENHLVGEQIIRVVNYLKYLYEEKDYTINQLFEEFNLINEGTKVLIVPKQVKNLLKGGRLSSLKKFILSKISLFPVLEYDVEGKVKNATLKRTFSGSFNYSVQEIVSFCLEGEKSDKNVKYHIDVISGIDPEVNKLIEAIQYFKPSSWTLTPIAIAVHTGVEAFALTVMPKLNYEEK